MPYGRVDAIVRTVAAVGFLARCELRRRWRSALALTLLVGFVGAVILASAAGARRSSTSLHRFIAFSRPSDVQLDLYDGDPALLAKVAQLPDVTDFAVMHAYALNVERHPNLQNAATVDGRLGTVIDRSRLITGRFANSNAPDEVDVGEGFATEQHLHVGDTFTATTETPHQLDIASSPNGNPGPPQGPTIHLHVVGIVRRPLDLGNLGTSGGVVIETPAFDREYHGRVGLFADVVRARLRHGHADVPAVSDAARRVFGSNVNQIQDVTNESHGASDAVSVLTIALWIFAGVATAAGAVTLAIVFARELANAGDDQETLDAIGLTRGQRISAIIVQTLVIACSGVALAVGAAALASPLFPFGIARRADPDPGVRIDGVVLLAGAAAVVLFVVALGSVAAFRATRPVWRRPAERLPRMGTTMVEVANRAGGRPAFTNGLRMAFDPGRGRSAVPVRSAIVGAIAGVAGLTAVLVFASSLAHLGASPGLYGWTWDFKAPDNSRSNSACNQQDYNLDKIPGVGQIGGVCYLTIQLQSRPTVGWGFTNIRGAIQPDIIRGRAAATDSEVALGAQTMRALGVHIGDTVTASGVKGHGTYRIVGQVTLPKMEDGDGQALADGAAFTGGGLQPLLDPNNHTRFVLGNYAPGANKDAVDNAINHLPNFAVPPEDRPFVTDYTVRRASRPPEVDRLRAIDWFPPALATLLAVLALAAVGHAVISAAVRRRRELALLKTFGFQRRQVRATVAWQATALAASGLLFGLPTGVLLGAFAWRRVADNLGIADVTVVPVLALVVLIPLAVALVNVLAFWPARIAARTWPASALASE